MVSFIEVGKTNQELLELNCISICQERFGLGDRIVICPKCNRPQHVECWELRGNRCGDAACDGSGVIRSGAIGERQRRERREQERQRQGFSTSTIVVLGSILLLAGIFVGSRISGANPTPTISSPVQVAGDFPDTDTNQDSETFETPNTSANPVVSDPVFVYDCDELWNNPDYYMLQVKSGDQVQRYPPKTIAETGNLFTRSIEIYIGNNSTLLDEVHEALFCFQSISQAQNYFDSFARDYEYEEIGAANKGYWGSDKFHVVVLDRNIVIDIKGDGSSYVESETVDQAVIALQRARFLSEIVE